VLKEKKRAKLTYFFGSYRHHFVITVATAPLAVRSAHRDVMRLDILFFEDLALLLLKTCKSLLSCNKLAVSQRRL
jgi:hypothetical protein